LLKKKNNFLIYSINIAQKNLFIVLYFISNKIIEYYAKIKNKFVTFSHLFR
jgi:hypothetical protein